MIYVALILSFLAGAGVKEILDPLGRKKSIHAVVAFIYTVAAILIVYSYS